MHKPSCRAWNIDPDGYPVTEAMKSFADQVNKGTQGRYQIEVFSNATLGDQPKAVQMLKSGEIDLAEFSFGPTVGRGAGHKGAEPAVSVHRLVPTCSPPGWQAR